MVSNLWTSQSELSLFAEVDTVVDTRAALGAPYLSKGRPLIGEACEEDRVG